MKHILFCGLLLFRGVAGAAAPIIELKLDPVALTGQLAPVLGNNVKFSSFEYVSLADNGQIAFTAKVSGPGVTSTNNLGLWAGLPDSVNLLARTGADERTAPDLSGCSKH